MAIHSDAEKRVIAEYARKAAHLGTFAFNPDGSINVGHRRFTDIQEAIEFKTSINMSSFASFTHGQATHELPRLGAGRYRALEGLFQTLIETDTTGTLQGATMERISFARDKTGATAAVLNEFRDPTTGTFSGFVHNTKENINVIRIKLANAQSGQEYLTDRQIYERLSTLLQMSDSGNINKRLNTIMNMEEYGGYLPSDQRLRVRMFDPLDETDSVTKSFGRKISAREAKHGWDGLIVGNPFTILNRAKQMEDEAAALAKSFNPSDMSRAAIEARQDAASTIAKARNLRDIVAQGGRMQDFRALGLIDAATNTELEGMLKGDIFIPTIKNYFAGMARYGINADAARNIDFLAAKGAVKKELSMRNIAGKAMSYFTVRTTGAHGKVMLDLQTQATVGDHLIDLQRLSRHTSDIMTAELTAIRDTGKISPGYREALQKVLTKEIPDDGSTIMQLRNAKAHARAILAMQDSPLPMSPEDINEVINGIQKGLIHHRYPYAANFMAPGAASGHIGTAEIATNFGAIRGEVAPGELRFGRNFGWAIHGETLADIAPLHGGSDLDDLVNQHLRRIIGDNGETLGYKAIGLRSPNTMGESALLDFDPRKNLDLIDLIGRADPRYRDETKAAMRAYSAAVQARRLDEQYAGAVMDFSDAEFNLNNAQTNATRKAFKRAQRRMERLDLLRARAVAKSGGISVFEAENRILAIGDEFIPTATQAEVGYFGRTDKAGQPRKSYIQTSFDDWMRAHPGISEDDLLGKAVTFDEDIENFKRTLTGLDEFTQRGMIDSMMREAVGSYGGLGGYSNVDMMANYMIHNMEKKPGTLGRGGMIAYTPMDEIIDLLVQGMSGEEGGLTFKDALIRRGAMMHGMAEAVALHGESIPEQFFNEKMRPAQHELFKLIKQYNPTFFDDKDFTDILGKSAYEEAAEEYMGLLDDNKELGRRVVNKAYADAPSSRYAFSLAEQEEARRIFDIYQATMQHYDAKGVGGFFDDPAISALAGEIDADLDPVATRGRIAIEREFARHMKDGRLSDEGTRVFGALLQGNRRKLARVMNSGNLREMAVFTDNFIASKQGSIAALEEQIANSSDQTVIDDLTRQINAQKDIINRGITVDDLRPAIETRFDDELEEGLDLVRNRPGFMRHAELDASFGQAAATTRGTGGAASDYYKRFHPDDVRALWRESKLLRRGTLAAGALIGFSAIYQKFRDRSPEDMAGPPLLPGGSAYERMPQFNMQPDSLTPVSDGRGGVTYKIIADGQYDPLDLQSAIRGILGDDVPMDGSYYNTQSRISRPRYNRPREDLFGQV